MTGYYYTSATPDWQVGTLCFLSVLEVDGLCIEMHDDILFHFEIFKNFMKILKYFKTPF